MKNLASPQSIAWFQDHYRNGRLVIRPPFQRKPVWLAKQRCALIESILMDIPIPEVYVQVTVADDGEEEFGVVDGQQRLRSILQFVGLERTEDQEGENNNNFSLEKLPETSNYKDKTFADIIGPARKSFFQYQICVRFLYTEDPSEIEGVFKRLNKYTMPLKPQELRNATFHGPFAKLSEKLADDEYWAVNRIISPAAIRRMFDIEMMSDLLIGLLHGPQGGSAKVIDEYYEQYEQFEDEFPEENRIKRLFSMTLDLIKILFNDIADVPRWGNRADYYSLFVAFGNLLSTYVLPPKNEKQLRECLLNFAEEIDQHLQDPSANTGEPSSKYARAIEKGSNDKARRVDRHEVIVDLIKPFLKEKK